MDVPADVRVVDEVDPLLLEDRDPPVDDPLLKLGVRDSEAHQPTRALVALVHGHAVTAVVELGCGRKPGGTGPDHGDLLAGPPIWGLGYQPSLLERPLRDRHLDLLD